MALVGDVVKELVVESTNTLLTTVIGRISHQITLAWGLKSELRALELHLKRLDSVLCGIQPGTISNRLLQDWLKHVREVACLADNVIDEYSYKRKIIKTRFFFFFFFSLSSNPALFRFQMARKVNFVKENIDKVYREADKLGFKPGKVSGGKAYVYGDCADEIDARLSLQRESPDSESLLGREGDKDQIVRMLREASSSSKHLSVVGVYGPPGLGKTALCKTIFNASEVKKEFEDRIWVCVSHDFEFKRLMNDIAEQIGDKQPISNSSTHIIKKKLGDKMLERKFLLVLDDVWATFLGYWEPLKSCLQNVGTSTGNTILVTSRISDTLASMTTPLHVPCTHPLRSLSEDESWCLFVRCVGENILSNSTKEDMAKKMLGKCKGVPLAIKVLGGLLRSQNSTSQWEEIERESSIWNSEDDRLPLILPSVKLSFKYLPFVQLKQCFAYCAMFKEDEVIERDRLIQLWMAQGLLQPHDEGEKLCDELLGEKYFRILLNYSLFQDAEFDDLGKVKACKMHDVVCLLARNISSGYNEIAQQRSLHLKAFPKPVSCFDRIRTKNPITEIKFLRILVLAGPSLSELPDSIGKLLHLRYLEIFVGEMERLPTGLGKLYYLQALRIHVGQYSHGGVPRFPEEFFIKLGNLRHLHTNLPIGMPTGLGMLTSLRTLPVLDFSMDAWGGKASELLNLRNLHGKLELRGLRHPVLIEQLKKAQLGTKQNIESLVLGFSKSSAQRNVDNHMMILASIEPHPNLVALEIDNYESKTWPSWTTNMTGYRGSPLNNLIFLRLQHCDAIKQPPCMTNLTSLKELRMDSCYEATSLPNIECLVSLQRLELSHCLNMENLPDITSLSSLKVLKIKGCAKMSCLPSGLSDLPTLETLVVFSLSKDVTTFPFPELDHRSPLSASLRELYIGALWMDEVVDLPDQIQHLRQLRCLQIEWFRNLKEVPEWIEKLTLLETLTLKHLLLVKQLPSQAAMQCLLQLKALRIYYCPLLKKACETLDGPEQVKIQNIRHVDIRERL